MQQCSNEVWFCHCCSAKNSIELKKCKVCGRDESYAQEGYPLPFFGRGAAIFRPSQIVHVLEDLNEVDSEGWTSLHSACMQGNTDLALELLRLGAEVNSVTSKGLTPLHLAVYSGDFDIVKNIIESGANIHAYTLYEKNTPLHFACKYGRFKMTQYLIEKGAVVDCKNVTEQTPLHMAAITGRADLGALLLRCGAKPDSLDSQGFCPRQLAELHGHRPFEELIVRSTMKEKQVMFKELPVAPWHNEIWTDVLRFQRIREQTSHRDENQWKRTMEEVEIAKERELAKLNAEKERKRQENLQQRKLDQERMDREEQQIKKVSDKYNIVRKPKTPTSRGNSSRALMPITLLGYDRASMDRNELLEEQLLQRQEERNRRGKSLEMLILGPMNNTSLKRSMESRQADLDFNSIMETMISAKSKKNHSNVNTSRSSAVSTARKASKYIGPSMSVELGSALENSVGDNVSVVSSVSGLD